MIKTINGRRYLMRDKRPLAEIRKMHAAYCAKYGDIDMHKWLVERGKVYLEVKKRG